MTDRDDKRPGEGDPDPNQDDLDRAALADEEFDAFVKELDDAVLEPADGWVRDRIARTTMPPGASTSDVPARPSSPPRTPVPSSYPPLQFPSQSPPPFEDEVSGDALDLVSRSRSSPPGLDLASEMVDRIALGDFTGALRAADLLLGREPDHIEAKRYAEMCRERLGQLYLSRLGSLSNVPHVALPDFELRWLGLDHRAGFLLSRIDGASSFEEILEMSGMSRLEALKTLVELLEMGAIRMGRT